MKTSQTLPARRPTAPVDDSPGRITSLDVARGVAVLGIVIPNIVGLGQPTTATVWPGAFLSPPGPYADWLWGAQLVLVDGKFRGLFTLLFGAGMVLFYRAAVAKGSGAGLLARRLVWLGVFGFAHWLLLWRGDILLSYAVTGFMVLAFVGWDWTKQLALGVIGYGAAALVGLANSLPMATTASDMAERQAALGAAQSAALADGRVEAALLAGGDQSGVVSHALGAHLPSLPAELLFGLFEGAPLMLIGMGLLGAGLFDGGISGRSQRRWGWTLWLAGTLATMPIAAWAMSRGITYWDSFAAFTSWSALPRLAAALGLLALVALWGQRSKAWLAARLAAAGRCAFSNYIGTSALALAVFAGWGLGLYGRLGRLELYGVALIFWLMMLVWPAWWLSRFSHGPLEWLWRCLTYRRLVSIRR